MKLEVCVDTIAGLNAAVAGGADRIELCSCLAMGGLTPSVGLMELAAKAPIPVYAMIRPRGGNFIFSPQEVDQMKREIDAARNTNLAGVVLGANQHNTALDTNLLNTLMDHADGLGVTLHRVIDLAPDLIEATHAAVELGFERILSSGGAYKAIDGIENLTAMHKAATGRLSVMPGSGVNTQTAPDILQAAEFTEIHAGCGKTYPQDQRLLEFGFESAGEKRTDEELVRSLKTILQQNAYTK
ncbi:MULTISPECIES: copper homeostasis protein CutC [unclassified Pseudovibrio]|uniref:copper homeostasis protein CutC n=1 Tax=unclassified Pseudovibrio TaxID=2627060 RepID=UPI0007AE6960|nr:MULTISPECIES: copper homeostasis protein CutC [unclassified Pseudovibrio]KZL03713.1 Copper homeostasis protein CutC [Pseudovibrio sp. W74]KZL09573.1 Copper homeostasis protein CutC [Pseudovibrio sp. Ad14]